MQFLYAPPMRQYEIYLFSVGAEKLTYQQVTDCIIDMGFNPFQGRKLIYHVFELWRAHVITFPEDQGHIVGLEEKEKLPSIGLNGSKMYQFPIIFRSLMGAAKLSESEFSESDKVNDFSNMYVICTKLKTKEGG